MIESNGKIDDLLAEEVTVGYKPTLPLEALWMSGTDMPQVTLRRDLEFMQMHPIIVVALDYYKSGLSGVEFWGGPNIANPDDRHGEPVSQDANVARFVLAHAQKLWRECVPKLQDGGYPYGWAPGEHVYKTVDGCLVWSYMKDFHPNDSFILTHDYRPVGVRIKGVRGRQPVDMWFASGAVPAKAAWYAHRARFSHSYGRSQLIGAWRPWRRLGWRDGVEEVIDSAIYRAGYAGPVVYHPKEAQQTARSGVPSTQADGAGRMRRDARDAARQILEYLKHGSGVTLSSEQYTQQQGGGPKWKVDWPTAVMDVMPLVKAAMYVEDQIFYGVGVPPELIRASGTGSGYSGRNIPREAFLCSQQHIADAMLKMLVDEVIRPLVLTNFGDVPFNVACKSLLRSQVSDKTPVDDAHPRDALGHFAPKGTQGPGTGSTTNPGGA